MKLGISGQALCQAKSLEEILQILQKHNVNTIEIWPQNIVPSSGLPVHPNTYENRDVEVAVKTLEKYKIRAACVSIDAAFNRTISSDVQKYAAELVRTVETAYMLNAPLVNHYCYYLSLDDQPDISQLMKYWEPVIKRADDLGIMLVLENEAHDVTRTPDGMRSLLKQIDSPNFRTNFDATNYYHASCEGFPYAYEVLKDYIGYVHIKNGCIFNPKAGHCEESKGEPMSGANEGKAFYYPPVGEGAVNLDGLLHRLQADGYKGYCTLEPHTKPHLVEKYYEEEISYLRKRGFFI